MWTGEVTRRGRWGRMALWKLESKIAAWSYRTSVNRLQWRDLAQHPSTSFGRCQNRVMLFCIVSEVVTLGWQRYIVAIVTVWLTNHKILPFGMVTSVCYMFSQLGTWWRSTLMVQSKVQERWAGRSLARIALKEILAEQRCQVRKKCGGIRGV